MSNIVTYEQKLSLRKIGYDFDNKCFCGGAMDCVCEFLPDENKLITVSEALDYIREEKGIECGVYPVVKELKDQEKPIGIFYEYCFIDYKRYPKVKINELYSHIAIFETHPLASSALLTAVLEYLEKKGIISLD